MSREDFKSMADPDNSKSGDRADSQADGQADDSTTDNIERPREIGGRGGLDPTRFGDWEKAGRCVDF